MQLTEHKKENQTILKNGRKIYGSVSFNQNPDYKWVLYLKGSIALSGFNTEREAIDKANKMFAEWKNVIHSILNL